MLICFGPFLSKLENLIWEKSQKPLNILKKLIETMKILVKFQNQRNFK